MINFIKRKALHGLFIISVIGTLWYISKHTSFTHIIECPPQNEKCLSSQAITHFQQELDEYEKLSWDLLQTATKIDQNVCLEHQAKQYKNYQKRQEENWKNKRSNLPPLREETITFVQNILRDFDIDPTNIQIVPYKGKGSPAAADDCTIFINQNEFDLYSPDGCKFFIAHEIAHLQAQDDSIYQSLCKLSNKKKVSQKKKKQNETKEALDNFRRFQETRADVHALIHGGKSYAQGAFDFMNKLQELDGGDNPGITHPKTSKRIEKAQEICSMMEWNIANQHA